MRRAGCRTHRRGRVGYVIYGIRTRGCIAETLGRLAILQGCASCEAGNGES